jgi:crossover junction endodeoxyribonuclease RuvC
LRVLGVDPGIANTGYGLVVEESGRVFAEMHGSIETSGSEEMPSRLDRLYERMTEVIGGSAPEVAVVEQLFFNTNLKTAVAVGQARGVILLACHRAGIQLAEYTPLQVKQAVAGNGNATKEQVSFMVCALLQISEPPGTLHASDALAMAVCHLQSRRYKELTGS